MKKEARMILRISSELKERIKKQAGKFNNGNISKYVEEALLYCLKEDENIIKEEREKITNGVQSLQDILQLSGKEEV